MERLSYIETIPAEILQQIISFLGPGDKRSLAKVSKYLYNVTYPYFWHQFRLPILDNVYNVAPLEKLLEIIKERGVDSMGFSHIKTLCIASFSEHPWLYGSTFVDEMFDILTERLVSGVLKPSHIRLKWGVFPKGRESVVKFLKAIKGYSESNSPQKLSITAEFSCFDQTKSLQETVPWGRLTTIKVSIPKVIDRFNSAEETERNIKILTDILKKTPSLNRLTMIGTTSIPNCYVPLSELPGLRQLQSAILDLKQLRHLGIEGMLFHPSFFIIPPENVEDLFLWQRVSIAWWRKFAQCPLKRVKYLDINAEHIKISQSGRMPSWLAPDDVEGNILRDQTFEFNFILGDLALQSLVWLSTTPTCFYCPDDFIDLILERNRDLQNDVREQFSKIEIKSAWKQGTYQLWRF